MSFDDFAREASTERMRYWYEKYRNAAQWSLVQLPYTDDDIISNLITAPTPTMEKKMLRKKKPVEVPKAEPLKSIPKPIKLEWSNGHLSILQGEGIASFAGDCIDLRRRTEWGWKYHRISPAKLQLLIQLHGEEVK